MKKEDYMKLSKDRLAELLEERDQQQQIQPIYVPTVTPTPNYIPMCYEPGGVCTNPHRDCINCPRMFTGGLQFHTTCTTQAHLNDNLNE
jgi:hypothetical protein